MLHGRAEQKEQNSVCSIYHLCKMEGEICIFLIKYKAFGRTYKKLVASGREVAGWG